MNLKKYLKECNNVVHTTINPKGPGVVRIHLVPPKKLAVGVPFVAIINGYSLIPLQTTWAVLLREFILTINMIDGNEIDDSYLDTIISKVVLNVKKIYPEAKDKMIKSDLKDIVETLVDIALGKEPKVEIGYTTLAKYSKFMYSPHRMDLMISAMEKNGCWNCNQRCLHCYAANEKMANVEELKTEDWFKIIDKCYTARIPALTFTGGEPTKRNDLVALVNHAKWFVTRLNTNGILLTKELCKNLYDASLDSVQITLYSFDENIHNTLVGANHFKETVEGIKNALEAGLDVSINTPLCSLNKDYVNTIKFAESLGVRYFSTSGLIPSGNAKNAISEVTKLNENEIYKSLRLAYDYAKTKNLEIAFTSPGWIKDDLLLKMHMIIPSCGACMSNMAIAPNGEVLPCQSWLFEDGLGNILNKSFKNIWNSKKCKKIRKTSATSHGLCQLKEVKK